ncbi:MAG: Holliday junction resolvase RuvX [Hyphomicrobiaceae bacterium]
MMSDGSPAKPLISDDLRAFCTVLPVNGGLLGLDLGTKTIGVARSDMTRTIASSVETIRRRKFKLDAARLLELARDDDICGIVLGLPLNLNGSSGPRAQATRAFARNLSGVLALPILLWDERLSTVAAERALLEADASRAKRHEVIDQVAATLILQSALEALNKNGTPSQD